MNNWIEHDGELPDGTPAKITWKMKTGDTYQFIHELVYDSIEIECKEHLEVNWNIPSDLNPWIKFIVHTDDGDEVDCMYITRERIKTGEARFKITAVEEEDEF